MSDTPNVFWGDCVAWQRLSSVLSRSPFGSPFLSGNVGESVRWCFHWCHAGMSGAGRKKRSWPMVRTAPRRGANNWVIGLAVLVVVILGRRAAKR